MRWLLLAGLCLPVTKDYRGFERPGTKMLSFSELLDVSYENGDSDGEAARTVVRMFSHSPEARAEFTAMIDQFLSDPQAVDDELILHGCDVLSYYDVDVSPLADSLFGLCLSPRAQIVIQTSAVYTLAKYSATRTNPWIADRIYGELPIRLQSRSTEAILRNYRPGSSKEYIVAVIRRSLASMSRDAEVKTRESLLSSFVILLPRVRDVSLEDIPRMCDTADQRLIVFLSLLPARQILEDRTAKGMVYQLGQSDDLCRWYYAEYLEFYAEGSRPWP